LEVRGWLAKYINAPKLSESIAAADVPSGSRGTVFAPQSKWTVGGPSWSMAQRLTL